STNALKYGALTAPKGQVAVGWQVSGERLRLHWRERGGPLVRPPERRGFGTRLLERGVGRELGADAMLVFDPDGVRFTLGLPLDARAGGAPSRRD
ncbi:MAG: sensor histidine kinase, partial [Phenylobacterium sp.]